MENPGVCEALKPFLSIEMAGYGIYKNALREVMMFLGGDVPEETFGTLDQILSRF